MQRLTYKTEKGWVGVHNLDDKTVSPTSVAIHKLAEFEDFMENFDFDDLEELEHYVQEIHNHYEEVKNKGTCGLCHYLDNEQIELLKKENTELEQQLSNCIVKPKFKVGDTIFVIVNEQIEEYFVDEILLRNRGTLWAYYDICKKTEITEKNEIFATQEEAKAKLEKMNK